MASNSDRNRQIIAAAYDLLEEKGLDGLTIRAVLDRTGLARRAFYEAFAGKDELVLAVFEQTLRSAGAHFSEQVAPLPDPMARLKLIVTSIVLGKASPDDETSGHGNRRSAALSREHLRLSESHPNDLQRALEPLIHLIARQLADGMAAGMVRDYDPLRLAGLVYNVVSTTVHTELLTGEGSEPDPRKSAQLAAEIWEFCRRAIAA